MPMGTWQPWTQAVLKILILNDVLLKIWLIFSTKKENKLNLN